tara:strand:- start:24 stop:563 length:540 start_codon:yes stop_codon:yes gene_type:complete
MTSPCQILESNYNDLGFGDPEADFNSGVFAQIESDFTAIDFSQENIFSTCNPQTIYSNLGFGDSEFIEVDGVGYSNNEDTNFSSSELDFTEINIFVSKFKKTTTYHYGVIEIGNNINFADVSLPSKFTSMPVVNCTIIGEDMNVYTSNISKSSFRINKSQPYSVKVNYFVSQDKFLFNP